MHLFMSIHQHILESMLISTFPSSLVLFLRDLGALIYLLTDIYKSIKILWKHSCISEEKLDNYVMYLWTFIYSQINHKCDVDNNLRYKLVPVEKLAGETSMRHKPQAWIWVGLESFTSNCRHANGVGSQDKFNTTRPASGAQWLWTVLEPSINNSNHSSKLYSGYRRLFSDVYIRRRRVKKQRMWTPRNE